MSSSKNGQYTSESIAVHESQICRCRDNVTETESNTSFKSTILSTSTKYTETSCTDEEISQTLAAEHSTNCKDKCNKSKPIFKCKKRCECVSIKPTKNLYLYIKKSGSNNSYKLYQKKESEFTSKGKKQQRPLTAKGEGIYYPPHICESDTRNFPSYLCMNYKDRLLNCHGVAQPEPNTNMKYTCKCIPIKERKRKPSNRKLHCHCMYYKRKHSSETKLIGNCHCTHNKKEVIKDQYEQVQSKCHCTHNKKEVIKDQYEQVQSKCHCTHNIKEKSSDCTSMRRKTNVQHSCHCTHHKKKVNEKCEQPRNNSDKRICENSSQNKEKLINIQETKTIFISEPRQTVFKQNISQASLKITIKAKAKNRSESEISSKSSQTSCNKSKKNPLNKDLIEPVKKNNLNSFFTCSSTTSLETNYDPEVIDEATSSKNMIVNYFSVVSENKGEEVRQLVKAERNEKEQISKQFKARRRLVRKRISSMKSRTNYMKRKPFVVPKKISNSQRRKNMSTTKSTNESNLTLNNPKRNSSSRKILAIKIENTLPEMEISVSKRLMLEEILKTVKKTSKNSTGTFVRPHVKYTPSEKIKNPKYPLNLVTCTYYDLNKHQPIQNQQLYYVDSINNSLEQNCNSRESVCYRNLQSKGNSTTPPLVLIPPETEKCDESSQNSGDESNDDVVNTKRLDAINPSASGNAFKGDIIELSKEIITEYFENILKCESTMTFINKTHQKCPKRNRNRKTDVKKNDSADNSIKLKRVSKEFKILDDVNLTRKHAACTKGPQLNDVAFKDKKILIIPKVLKRHKRASKEGSAHRFDVNVNTIRKFGKSVSNRQVSVQQQLKPAKAIWEPGDGEEVANSSTFMPPKQTHDKNG